MRSGDDDDEAVVSTQREVAERSRRLVGEDARERLLAGIPVTERRLELAGVSTAVADDPAIRQPEAFLQARRAALETMTGEEAAR